VRGTKINETIIASGNEIAETVASRRRHPTHRRSGTRIADRIFEQGNSIHERIVDPGTNQQRDGEPRRFAQRIASSREMADYRGRGNATYERIRLVREIADTIEDAAPPSTIDHRSHPACRRRHRTRGLDPSEDPHLRPRCRQRHQPWRDYPEDHRIGHRRRRSIESRGTAIGRRGGGSASTT
jgi:hypothetical protein